MIRSTAEAIMESLRLLLYILMNQIDMKAPDQQVEDAHAQTLHALLTEVQTQKT